MNKVPFHHSCISTVPSDEHCMNIANFFKVFSDNSRIKILYAMIGKEICVHDLSIIVGMSQSAVSHQLTTLRHYKVLKVRRDGKAAFYSLEDEHIQSVLSHGAGHILHI